MQWLYWSGLSAVSTALLIVLSSIGLRGVDPLTATTLRAFMLFAVLFPIWLYCYMKGNIRIESTATSTRYLQFAIAAAVVGVLSWYTYNKALAVAKDEEVSAAAVTTINYASVVLIALALPLQNRIEIYLGAPPDKLPSLTSINWLGIVLVVVGSYFAARR